MENGDAIVWKNNLQLLGKSTCKKHRLVYININGYKKEDACKAR
jgi:hypothetical protein